MLATTVFSALLAATAMASPHGLKPSHDIGKIVDTTTRWTEKKKSSLRRAAVVPIRFPYGSKVLTNGVTVHYIYYGDWSGDQKSIIQDLTNGLGRSKWWNTERKYYSQRSSTSRKVYVNGQVRVGSTVQDNYTFGRSLTGDNIASLIQKYIDSGDLPEQDDALYMILSAHDVSESQIGGDGNTYAFCRDYCGYHKQFTLSSGREVPFAFAGNGDHCQDFCVHPQNRQVSPNNDTGVDGMASIVIHEIAEAVTDPIYPTAWIDINGQENADKCNFSFGFWKTDFKGASYNQQIGGRNFLVQQNWNPNTNTCSDGTR
ncbi:hypothetical protein BDV3_003307 [Batrachochytrium dendrobatidis]|nr:hypothetical protein BDEG_24204 [Batrachochytrium dendrobatidis JEL423]